MSTLTPTLTQGVAVFSVRKIANLVAFTYLYEFEDVVTSLLDADLLTPDQSDIPQRYHKLYRLSKLVTRSSTLAKSIASVVLDRSAQGTSTKDYDLFLAHFNIPYELFMLKALPNWRKRSKKAVCYITEVWLAEFNRWRHFVEYLKEFDHIFLGSQQCVSVIAEMTGRPCSYLPLSVDTLRFCPRQVERTQPMIDVLNLGRRSPITHNALLNFAEENNMFYMYDTISINTVANAKQQQTFAVKNHREHRLLLANLLKRSRYYIANRARVNEAIGSDRQEISSRFFEGAAAGAILLGEAPQLAAFRENFDWDDAIIPLPFDTANPGEIIANLNNQPQRLEQISRMNVAQSLLRHDSVYRLKAMLAALEIDPTPAMVEREQALAQLAQRFLEPGTIAA